MRYFKNVNYEVYVPPNLPPTLVAGIADFSVQIGSAVTTKTVFTTDPESDAVTLTVTSVTPSFI